MNIIKIVLYLLSAIPLIIFSSCEKDDGIFKGPYHVRFTDSVLTFKESVSNPVKILVHNAGPVIKEDITITYSVSGNARKGIDYIILGPENSVSIPAGSSFGEISIQILNNANNILESQELILTITGVTPDNLDIGRSNHGVIGKSIRITIEDDCILSGSYYSPGPKDVGLPDIKDIKVTSTNCTEYTLSNWDIYITAYFPNTKDLIFNDNGDNSLSIPEQTEEFYGTMTGSGFVDPETNIITLNIQFMDLNDKPTIQVLFYPE